MSQDKSNSPEKTNVFYPLAILIGIIGNILSAFTQVQAIYSTLGIFISSLLIGIGIIGFFVNQKRISFKDGILYAVIWTMLISLAGAGYYIVISRDSIVYGLILDNANSRNPVSNVEVSLYQYGTGLTNQVRTNDTGEFRFRNVSDGEIDVIINGQTMFSDETPNGIAKLIDININTGRFYLDSIISSPLNQNLPPTPVSQQGNLEVTETIQHTPTRPISLTVWCSGGYVPAMLEVSSYLEANFAISLDVIEVDFTGLVDELMIVPENDSPDIFILPNDNLERLILADFVAPIELNDTSTRFSSRTLSSVIHNGNLYAMPIAFESVALIRNVDLIPEQPLTWQEVQEMGEILSSDDNSTYVIALQHYDAYHAYPILTAFGGYAFGLNRDGSYNLSDIGFANAGGIRAAEWLSEMYDKNLMPHDLNGDEIFELFEAGRLGLFITGPWYSERLTNTGINYSIDRLPGAEGGLQQGIAYLGVQGLMINNHSPNKVLAEQIVTQYFMSEEVHQIIFDFTRRLPAMLDIDTSIDPNTEDFILASEVTDTLPFMLASIWDIQGSAYASISQGANPVTTFTEAQIQIENLISN